MSTTIPTLHVLYTNCYLLKAREGWLLVDTGIPGCYDHFRAELAKLGVAIGDIRYVLLSHHHFDHAGLAAEIRRDSGARLIAHQAGIQFLEKGVSLLARGINPGVRFLKWWYLRSHRCRYRSVRLAEDDIVVEGDDSDVLRRIGIEAELLHTPGHSPDGLSVVFADGIALVGDCAMDLFNICLTNPRPILSDNIGVVYESWRKLAAHGARVILPAHGRQMPVERLLALAGRKI